MSSPRIFFASAAFVSFAAACNAQSISPKDAEKYVGKTATVCGQVASAIYLDRARSKPTLLNFEKPYPDHVFTAVIYGDDRPKFGAPEKACLKKDVCVTGEVSKFQNKPQIIVKDRNQLKGC